MDGEGRAAIQRRVERVRASVDLAALIGQSIKLRGRSRPRGQCPFHGSKSDSFAVYPDSGRARCWGCGWSGDAVQFVRDQFALDFMAALERLEADAGLSDLSPAPVARPRAPVKPRPRSFGEPVSAATWAAHIWSSCGEDRAGVIRWFVARGVPAAALTEARLRDVKFAAEAPIVAWREGEGPSGVPQAPAIASRIRRRSVSEAGRVSWPIVGLHLTFLSPSGTEKMVRQRRDGSAMPARKMIGQAAGAMVLLGDPRGDPPLAVGEGLETVLSGLAMLGDPAAVGVAALSLDTLQGRARTWKGGVLPLFAVRPDPERRGLAWPGAGPVTVLVDADMKPLRGPIDPRTGQPRGLPVVEARGGPIVSRTITSLERSEICAALAVASWRAAGRPRVSAVRPHLGQDFNDAVRGAA